MSAMSESRRERELRQNAEWDGASGLSRAFDGLVAPVDRPSDRRPGDKDLGETMEQTFGGEFGSIGAVFHRPEMREIALRILRLQHFARRVDAALKADTDSGPSPEQRLEEAQATLEEIHQAVAAVREVGDFHE